MNTNQYDFDSETATSHEIVESLGEFGIAIVRNFAYAEDVTALKALASGAFDRRDNAVIKLEELEDPESPYFSPVRMLREQPIFDVLLSADEQTSLILSLWNSVYRRISREQPVSHEQFWQEEQAGIPGVRHKNM